MVTSPREKTVLGRIVSVPLHNLYSKVLRFEDQRTTVVPKIFRTEGQETPRFVGHEAHGSRIGDDCLVAQLQGETTSNNDVE